MHFLARLQLRRGLQVRQRHPAYRRIMIAVIAVYGLNAFGTSTAQTWAAVTVVSALAAGA